MRRTSINTRYTVVAMTKRPASDLYGQRVEWSGDHVIMGHRAVMETAQTLMWKAIDGKGSIYVYAFVRDNEDGMVVLECERDDDPVLDSFFQIGEGEGHLGAELSRRVAGTDAA